MALTKAQQQLVARLVGMGVPLPVALTVALSDDPLGDVTAGLQAFNTGARAGLDAVASVPGLVVSKSKRRKVNRKARATLSKALKEANRRMRTKTGKLRKGKTQSDIMKLAQKLRKKMQ